MKNKQVGFHKDIDGKFVPLYGEETYKFTVSEYNSDLRLNVLDKLSDERWLLFLKRLRQIVEKEEYIEDNSNLTGLNHTHFSWGACSDDPKLWPDQQDMIWPERGLTCGKCSPLDSTAQTVPLLQDHEED